MARRASAIKIPKKQVRKTRSEVYIVNLKHLGPEASYSPGQVLSNLEKAHAFTWYGAMCSNDEAREFLVDYLATKNRKDDIKLLKNVPDSLIPLTCCWIARLAVLGVKHSEATHKFFDDGMKACLTGRQEIDDKKEKSEAARANAPSIQDRIKDKVSSIIGDIEGVLDDHMNGQIKDFDAYEYCQKMQLPAMHASKLITYFYDPFEELELAEAGTDDQVNEGYKKYGKGWIKARKAFLEKLVSDLYRYGQNAKKLKAPRKKKPQSVEKKMKHFKFKAEDQDMKLASVSPESIIGAQELWAYNVKYKTITVFRAIDRGGLDINRSSITKFDEKTTATYRTGRQGEKIVQTVLTGGKLILRKVTDGLKAATLQDRINENTVLLRAVK